MASPRYRLKTLMLMIFGFALAFGALAQAVRMTPLQWQRLREDSFLVVPFLIMIVLKLGFAVGARARRADPEGSTKPVVPDDPLS